MSYTPLTHIPDIRTRGARKPQKLSQPRVDFQYELSFDSSSADQLHSALSRNNKTSLSDFITHS